MLFDRSLRLTQLGLKIYSLGGNKKGVDEIKTYVFEDKLTK